MFDAIQKLAIPKDIPLTIPNPRYNRDQGEADNIPNPAIQIYKDVFNKLASIASSNTFYGQQSFYDTNGALGGVAQGGFGEADLLLEVISDLMDLDDPHKEQVYRSVSHIVPLVQTLKRHLSTQVYHLAVRPAINDYDVIYHAQQIQDYSVTGFRSVVIKCLLQDYLLAVASGLHPLYPFQKYVNDYPEPLPKNYEPHFLCFDAHYYFANFESIYYDYLPEPLHSASVHTTGGNFHPVPGRYLLP